MTRRVLPLLLLAGALAHAQESQPSMTPAEKEFQQSLSGVTLNGHFTKQDGSGITKLKDGLWRFETHIQYAGHDVKMPQ